MYLENYYLVSCHNIDSVFSSSTQVKLNLQKEDRISGVLACFIWPVCTRYPPWCYRPLQPRCLSLGSVPLVWCLGSAGPPGCPWTLRAPALCSPAAASLGHRRNKIALCFVYWIFLHGMFYQQVWGTHLPSCVVRGGSFLGTAPGNTGICLFSITTPLSVVPFDTAESPRPSSLLPVSFWQHRDTIWMQKKVERDIFISWPHSVCYPRHEVVMGTSLCWHIVMNTVSQEQ